MMPARRDKAVAICHGFLFCRFVIPPLFVRMAPDENDARIQR